MSCSTASKAVVESDDGFSQAALIVGLHRVTRVEHGDTANAPFSAWEEVFPDKAMTVAAVDRLVHHSTILEMNVSYRRRAALPARRQRSTKEPE